MALKARVPTANCRSFTQSCVRIGLAASNQNHLQQSSEHTSAIDRTVSTSILLVLQFSVTWKACEFDLPSTRHLCVKLNEL